MNTFTNIMNNIAEHNSRDSLVTGRFAPSPTGLLHLGNAWSFLLTWLCSRSCFGRIVLRIEDLDPDRSRREWSENIMTDLKWLGMDWDEGPDIGGPNGPYLQSERTQYYERMLRRLSELDIVYPCFCTRKELRELAGAPHGAADGLGDGGAAYPGTCRNLSQEERQTRIRSGRRSSLRLFCPDDRIEHFTDLVQGAQDIAIADCGGDFVLRRSDGVWAYQLAVVCDDIAMGITHVVRGEDIKFSTPRQLYLYHLFKEPYPVYAHVPLLHDSNGQRLAKRHKSLSLASLRQKGCRAEKVVGWLAWQAGLQEKPCPVMPVQLAEKLKSYNFHFLRRLSGKKIIVPDGIEVSWL